MVARWGPGVHSTLPLKVGFGPVCLRGRWGITSCKGAFGRRGNPPQKCFSHMGLAACYEQGAAIFGVAQKRIKAPAADASWHVHLV